MIKKIKKNIIISLILMGLGYLLFVFIFDYQNVIKALMSFSIVLLPVVLFLILINYFFRFLKWHYYLNLLRIDVPLFLSFMIFMSGLIMTVTPGKMGELLKSFMIKDYNGVKISKTAPIIIVERITDFLSLVMIAIAGAFVFNYGKLISIIVGLFFILVVLVISNRKLSLYIISIFEKIKYLTKIMEHLRISYESAYQLLKLKPLFLMVVLSMFSWFFECLGFYLIIRDFSYSGSGAEIISLFEASFIYAFATIVGAITMLPGGLGVTDGSLTFLLVNKNISPDVSLTITFLIRMVTLWFAVFIGILSVIVFQYNFGKINFNFQTNSFD